MVRAFFSLLNGFVFAVPSQVHANTFFEYKAKKLIVFLWIFITLGFEE